MLICNNPGTPHEMETAAYQMLHASPPQSLCRLPIMLIAA
jgi:hypothetical protein